jgi:hypothetical protein
MSVKTVFNFSLGLLAQEADYILDAAEAHFEINARLPADFIAQQRTLLDTLRTLASTQKSKTANVGGYTVGQNEAVAALNDLVSRAKDSAERAFKGQDVKLRNEFQVGVTSPGDLASVLQRARIVRDSSANAANAAALAAKGWVTIDTNALTSAIDVLDAADDTQETAKADKAGFTDARNTDANELYEGLLTIQNAANNQWPERVTANAVIRTEFRIGLFPPHSERKKQPAEPTLTPEPAHS